MWRFLLGFFASGLDLIDDARRERAVQRRTLEEVTEIIAEAAAKAAYDLNSSLAMDVLKGLLSYRPIFQASIHDEFGARLAGRERSGRSIAACACFRNGCSAMN